MLKVIDSTNRASGKRVLVLGAGGMLGHTLCRVLSKSHDVCGAIRTASPQVVRYLERHIGKEKLYLDFEALSETSLDETFAAARPQVVVNCVGIIKQIPEAGDVNLNIAVNAVFPHRLQSVCDRAGARLIHISTDCVFSGETGNYREDDIPDAEDLYGRTKLLGEVKGSALTLRTSMIGPQLSGHGNLFDWFLLNNNPRVQGFTRAVFSGLTTEELSTYLDSIISDFPQLSGLYHVASAPLDKYHLLQLIKSEYKLSIEIEKEERFTIDRSLNDEKFRSVTGLKRKSWDVMLQKNEEG